MAAPRGRDEGKKRPGAQGNDRGGSAKRPKLSNGKAAPPRGDKPASKGPGGFKPRPKPNTPGAKDKDVVKKPMRKNGTLIEEAVTLWEALRPSSTSAEEKAALVTQILSKLEGRLVELASNHKASRIIQFCAKYGNEQQRKDVMGQVKANMVQLAKSKYGHHLVRKLVSVSTKEQVPDLVKSLRGHMMELLRHPQGADVLVDLYDVASTQMRNTMCAEFYGREFVLFDGVKQQGNVLSSLTSLLAGEGPAKRRSVMQHMTKALVPVMEKGLLHPPMTHRLLRDFLDNAPSMSVEDAVDTLSATGPALLKLVHTHDGAAVACAALGYGTAKDRKRIVKAMKGHVSSMATNEWAFVVLAMALTVVDDTSLTSKTICAELKAMMSDAVEDTHAARVLLQLLHPNQSRYVTPAGLAMMILPQRTVKSTGKIVTDIEGDEDDLMQDAGPSGKDNKVAKGSKKSSKADASQDSDAEGDDKQGTGEPGARGDGDASQEGEERVLGLSKKDPLSRRRELLASGGKDSFAASLLRACTPVAGALLRGPVTCDLIVEAARGGEGALLQEIAPTELTQLHDAIVAEAARDDADVAAQAPVDAEEAGPAAAPPAEHIFTQFYSSRALRRLLLASADDGPAAPATALAAKLWSGACAGRCRRWVGGHGEKVLAALLHCASPEVRNAAAKEIGPLIKPVSVEEWSAKLTSQGHQPKKHAGAGEGAASPQQASKEEGKAVKGKGQQGQASADADAGTAPKRAKKAKKM